MNTNRSPLFAFDPRWERHGAVLDAIAIIKDFEEKIKSINSHALHPDLLNIAVNLGEIHREATGMRSDLAKMQAHLNRLLGAIEQELYQQPMESDLIKMQAHINRLLGVAEQELYRHPPEDEMKNGNGKQKTQLKRQRRARPTRKPKFRGSRAKLTQPGK